MNQVSDRARLRTCVRFVSTVPDDGFEVDDEVVEEGGRNVAAAIQEILGAFGCGLDPVEAVPEHGCHFRFRYRGRTLQCHVADLRPYLASFIDRRGSPAVAHPDFVELMRRLADALAADPRFLKIGWFYEDEPTLRRAGATRPDDGLAPLAAGVATGAWSDLSPHPFRRSAARFFDAYLVSGLFFFAGVATLTYSSSAAIYWAPLLLTALFPLRAVAGLFFNALMLRWTATTPGKWLCGIRIVPRHGGRLTISLALKRELEVALAGCAIYAPLLSMIAMYFNWSQLRDDGATSWDERGGLVAVQRPNSPLQFALTLFVFAPLAAGFVMMDAFMDHLHR